MTEAEYDDMRERWASLLLLAAAAGRLRLEDRARDATWLRWDAEGRGDRVWRFRAWRRAHHGALVRLCP